MDTAYNMIYDSSKRFKSSETQETTLITCKQD